MKTPRYIATVSLLIWTVLTGFWLPGIAMLILIESYRWHQRRWGFTENDDKRFVNAASLSFGVSLLYSWLNPQGSFVFLETVQFGVSSEVLGNVETFQAYEFLILIAPMLFYPIFWATRFRISPPPTYRIFSRYLPKKIKEESNWIHKNIPTEGGYALICLASASKTQSVGLSYYIPICAVIAWFLWENRPGKRNYKAWAGQFLFSIVAAYFLFLGLSELQAVFQEKFINYIAQLSQRDAIPRDAKTQIGKVGKLNLSGKIVIRAKGEIKTPFLLQQDFYDEYGRGRWLTSNFKTVTNVLDDGDLESWTLRSPRTSTNISTIKLSHSLKLNGGRLPLQMNAFRLNNLPVGEVLTNRYGRVSVVDGPGLLIYEVENSGNLNHLAIPPLQSRRRQMNDLSIQKREQPHINAIASELGIKNKYYELDHKEIASRVSNYFVSNNFTYSTQLKAEEAPPKGTSAIGHFLTELKKGHCEYFATATTLLMRSAGIPARYVTGYSVAEKREDTFIVRERDAHAWCQYYAFDEGIWYDLDTTPADWREKDQEFASRFESLGDFISNITYHLSRLFWIWVQKAQEFEVLLGGVLVIFFGFLIFRIMRQQNQQKLKKKTNDAWLKWEPHGMDSAFFAVISQLDKMGYHRAESETLFAWIKNRIPNNQNLIKLAQIHNKYRFDPIEFPKDLKSEFFQMVEDEIQQLKLIESEKAAQ